GDGEPHEDAECHVGESRQPHELTVDKLHRGCKLKGWSGGGDQRAPPEGGLVTLFCVMAGLPFMLKVFSSQVSP
ncbi:hypothetical protein AB0O32_40390, partial [Streptomyces rubiginosohelvolus]|uniref:hypothetical protein n=1 Tax=Streptomyces rubiginosohelvolus TaxID=67362 RepID=UPI00342A0FFC